eukprot:EC787570.1.p1 GENE.EC787570.1~~EC787570.1.p1  ORF type:complete len:131 (+),score=42.37 EC787570.1:88-480(+)
MTPFLDRHMVLRVLGFVEKSEVFPRADMQRAQLEAASGTALVQLIDDLRKATATSADADDQQRRQQQVANMLEMRSRCANLLTVLDDAALLEDLRSSSRLTADHLRSAHNVAAGEVEALYLAGARRVRCG